MSKLQFKFYNQAQGELFPSFLGEKIPETHHVRLLSGIVDALDIRFVGNLQVLRLSRVSSSHAT